MAQEKAHAELGASSAHRWMECPGSVRLSAGIADHGSIYAAEGTAAHTLAEACLNGGQDAIEYIDRSFAVGNHVFVVDEEMAAHVQVYLDAVRHNVRPGDELFIEQRFDLSNVIHEGMFGTNDAAIYRPSTGELFVYDLKYGAGYAVEAAANPQLLYYAVGGATAKKGRTLKTVTIVIVQPRAPHRDGPVRAWSASAADLMEWMADLKTAAMATLEPDAVLKPGEWCKFCRAAAICPKLREDALAAAQAEFAGAPSDLNPEQFAAILEKADLIESWVKAVRAYAHSTLDNGGEVPGFKLVQKRAVRKWRDEDKTVSFMEMMHGFEADDLFIRKVKSPAQLEKLLAKSERESLKAFITSESSGTTLARDTDPRAAVTGSGGAAAEFDAVE